MPALRLAHLLILWSTVGCLGWLAYLRSVSASTFDGRLVFGLPFVLAAHGLGLLWLEGLRRRGARRLDGDGHALALVVSALGTLALSHVVPHTSIRVLREELPPFFAWLPLLLALAAPVLISLTRRRLDRADQGLALALFVLPLSGSLLLVEGPAALCLAVVALSGALCAPGLQRPALKLLAPALVLSALLIGAASWGTDPIQAAPAVPWIGAWTCLLVALAVRRRPGSDWRLFLALPVATAVLVALCGVILTAWLALEVSPESALATRLTLFRQHPNFLAPFFAFHAVLAGGLLLAARRGRIPTALACGLLLGATWHTDSRAGLLLALVGLPALPVLLLLARWLGRRPPALLTALVLGAPALAIGGLAALLALPGASLPEAVTAGLDRFEKSMDYRVDAWTNSIALVAQHPWTGIGPHTFLSLTRFQPGSRFFNAPESPHPHNVLLYLAQSVGWPGLCLFLLWIVTLLATLLAPTRDGRPRTLHLTLAAALMALLLANLLDVGLALDSVVPEPVFVATGLAAALSGRERQQPLRPGPAALLALLLVTGAAVLGFRPLLASSFLARAELRAALAGQGGPARAQFELARGDCARAIQLDPLRSRPYELLSRWLEDTEGGLLAAREVMLDLQARSPHRGATASLLAHMYLRARLDEEAVDQLRAALADSHGSVHLTRDRGELVAALARLGRRDEALEALVDGLALDVGVIQALPWRSGDAPGVKRLSIGAPGDSQRPIDLADALEILFGRYVQQREGGEVVGRRAWMELVGACRRAGRDDQALRVLADLEANVPDVERHSIANERGLILLDAGDAEGALAAFTQAHELSGGIAFFEAQANRARRILGQDVSDVEASDEAALTASGEILDMPALFQANLAARAAAAGAAGRFTEASALLTSTLLYEDDPLERGRLLTRAAEQALAGAAPQPALDAVAAALWHLDAKAYPPDMLAEGLDDTLPARLARIFCRAAAALGDSAAGRRTRAWSLPGFFRATPCGYLFRAAFFAENGQPDAQLREAELMLLDDERNLVARWQQLEALEGLGRHAEAKEVMRDIAELSRAGSEVTLERRFAQLVASGSQRLDDGAAWFEASLVRLLQGRYAEAADLMANAVALDRGAPEDRARLLGWQARAELFSDRSTSLAATRALLAQACDMAPGALSLRRRLEALP